MTQTKLNENAIEKFAIELLRDQGFVYSQGTEVFPDSERPLRDSYDDVLLKPILKEAIERINPSIPAHAQEDALKQVLDIASPSDLISTNETFHRMLTEGISVSYQKNNEERGDLVWLLDFENIPNNDFCVTNQFTITENHTSKRPDLILFVNGLPLVVFELKNAADEKATLRAAYDQLQTYKSAIPSLFTYNSILVVSDGLEARAGTISSEMNRFMQWKTVDGKADASKLMNGMEILIRGMLRKETLLDLIRHFIVFEESASIDSKTNITTLKAVKKLAAYHQYYAVNRAVESTLRASGFARKNRLALETSSGFAEKNASAAESPAEHGLPGVDAQDAGDRKAGVVWHTQGSGKSLSMLFYTGKIVLAMNNPSVLVITDRNDLDNQLFDTFASSKQLLRQEPVQADNRDALKGLLKVSSGGIVFSTIQKFHPNNGNVYEELSSRKNIVVIVDEAHRTQYGFQAKTLDDKDENGVTVGKKVVYGFAKYLRDALPHATYLGFTATPIEKTDINTPAVFGNYVDIYDISKALEDGATVPIYYESRLVEISLSEEGKQLVKELDADLENQDLSNTQASKAKSTKLEALIGSEERIKRIAKDIIEHFEERQAVLIGKGMIVSMSRRIATLLYKEIIELRPAWHCDDLSKGFIKVVITTSSSDGPELAAHHATKEQRRMLAERMKKPDDELKLVIVCDMWLTGFDVPSLHTLYIDKPLKGHNLMQAMGRVSRVYKDKTGGLVVDYLGITSDLEMALSFYSDNGGKGDPVILQERAVDIMHEKLEVVSRMFHGFAYAHYFNADTPEKLSLILAAEDHILKLENGIKRFITEVSALSQAFAIAIPHADALAAKDEIAFFQAIKARLCKFEGNANGKTDLEMETAIKQIIDKALVSDQVVDVFDAAGIKKPDISILSKEFLLEIQGMKHKHVALETLKKLLHDEIKARARKNLVQSRSLMEMLENSIKRYQSKILTTAEVINKLIEIAKNIMEMDKEPKEMELTEFEYAFYTAIADNDSAKELMQKDTLRELAIVLSEKIKKNTTIDWAIKENVRARIRTIVRRTLRKYGYPPDMSELATQTVLEQAEQHASSLSPPPPTPRSA